MNDNEKTMMFHHDFEKEKRCLLDEENHEVAVGDSPAALFEKHRKEKGTPLGTRTFWIEDGRFH